MQAYSAHMIMEIGLQRRQATEEDSNLIIGYGTNRLSSLTSVKVLPFLYNN
jgi:hypothetical protein